MNEDRSYADVMEARATSRIHHGGRILTQDWSLKNRPLMQNIHYVNGSFII